MTPLTVAKKVFAAGSDLTPTPKMAIALEAAITAYLTALSEDEATVEKVARQLCFMSIGGPEFQIRDPANDPFIDGNWKRHEDSARAALTALASQDERKA